MTVLTQGKRLHTILLSTAYGDVRYCVEAESNFLTTLENINMPRGIPNKQAANGKAVGKMEAVRQALVTLGRKAMPTEIREWIKSKFRIDVEPNSIAAFKT